MNPFVSFSEIPPALSPEQKIGQCLMPAAFLDDSEKEIQAMEKLIKEGYIGSLCFFQSRRLAAANVMAKHNLARIPENQDSYLSRLKALIERYQSAASVPLLIAIDGEWGLSMRLPDQPKYPYPLSLAALEDNLELIEQTGHAIGVECREAGVHWNLAPVVDINTNPDNPVIGYRAFGERTEQVVQCATAWLKGLGKSGVLNCLKHFPGHGDTSFDSHLTLPILNKSAAELDQEEWVPFKELKAEADSIMLGHLAVPQLTNEQPTPATLSPRLIGLLRDWGFEGVLISDALNMKSVALEFEQKGELEAEAFSAGCDVLCFSDHPLEAISIIHSRESIDRIEKSFQRIWALKVKAFSSYSQTPVSPPPYSNLIRSTAEKGLTLFKGTPESLRSFRLRNPKVVSIGHPVKASFTQKLDQEANEVSEDLVLSVHLSSPKPGKDFGLTSDEIEQLTQIILKASPWLYLFGNPYFLRCIPWKNCRGIVLLYENSEIHEEVAYQHYCGLLQAQGKSSIHLEE